MAYIYKNGAWTTADPKKYDLAVRTFTTYPFTIKSPTTPVNATIYGNMVQNGTPTPAAPITPTECGDLETTGEHANQYKIPILNNSQTTNLYLGEVESTRRIKMLVLTGQENWTMASNNTFRLGASALAIASKITSKCSHYQAITNRTALVDMTNRCVCMNSVNGELWIRDTDYGSSTDFNTYLATQYSAGTPVTVWYVLAEPTTGIVNEPIRKIGDYTDTVTTSIPVTINSDSVDINTTLKPSAVAAPSLSWSAGDDYKRSSGAWS